MRLSRGLCILVLFFCLGAERLNADLIYNLVDHGLLSHSVTGFIRVTDDAADDGILQPLEVTGWEVNIDGPFVSFSTTNFNPGARLFISGILIDAETIRIPSPSLIFQNNQVVYTEVQEEDVFLYTDSNFRGFPNIPESRINYSILEPPEFLNPIAGSEVEITGVGEERIHAVRADSDPTLAGDFDEDGDVDIVDIDFYVGNLGSVATGALAQLDLNGDDQITLDDLNTHLANFVQTSNGQTGTFPGDLNLDGVVDVLGDAFILVSNLGNSASSYGQGDVNLDGTVDVLGDAFVLVSNLGSTNVP